MTPDTMDARLAFLLQAHAEHIAARRTEDITKRVTSDKAVQKEAEGASNAAARMLDTACDEFLTEIRDYTKRVMMDAVAAMHQETPSGAPHSLRMHTA